MKPDCTNDVTNRLQAGSCQRWAQQHPHIRFASIHPGWVTTDGLKNAEAMAGFCGLMKGTLRTAAQGADTIAWLVAPATKEASGGYFWDRRQRAIDLP